jgi:hypothetical protein
LKCEISNGPNLITWILKSKDSFRAVDRGRCHHWNNAQRDAMFMAMKNNKGRHGSTNVVITRSWKSHENRFSLEPPGKMKPF